MIGLAYLEEGVAEETYLLKKEYQEDGSILYTVLDYYFGIIQDSRLETRNDYAPEGLYVVKLIRITQKGFPILEPLIHVAQPTLFPIYTAGLPWGILRDLLELEKRVGMVGGRENWQTAWKLLKEEPVEDVEKAIKILKEWKGLGAIDEEDYEYYLEKVKEVQK